MKTNSKQLHKAIMTIVSFRVTNTAYENIPKPVVYPYAIFSTRLLGTNYGQHRIQLDIDVASRDTETTEDLADLIQDDLDYITYSDDNIFFHVYRSTRYPVVEEDKGIERRRMTFELYFYTRS